MPKDNVSKFVLEQVKMMPRLPGCYQYYDAKGEVIYVGKAKNLFNRVKSYFTSNDSIKVNVMVPKIAKIECIVVDSEVEALILEAELIKKYKPRYNILLKDDKKFPYFLVTDEEYPRITVVRKANKNPQKGKYFGPYTDSRAMWATLELLGKIFPLKKCKTPKFNSRPCLYYDIGQCTAPCQKMISSDEYKKILKDAMMFLSGRQSELLRALENEMKKYAKNLEFEKAARYRNSYLDIQKTMEKQKIVSENSKLNQDFIGIVKDGNLYSVSILEVREGRLINKKDFDFSKYSEVFNEPAEETLGNTSDVRVNEETNAPVTDFAEVSKAVMREYYSILNDTDIPKDIIMTTLPEDSSVYEKWLGGRSGKKVSLKVPKGKKEEEILALAQKNAEFNVGQLCLKELAELQNDYNEVGAYIQEKLGLTKFPHTIECYDISHIQGTNTVASRVFFENGMPKKSQYRRYKLRTIKKGEVDDFKSMREVLSRRFKRIQNGDDTAPDLIIIDGGKGQLSSVYEIMQEFGLKIDLVSLAKREEEVFKPNQSEPVIFPVKSPALHLFQRVRDEAHRFAVTYHKKLRSKSMLE
ncbi:MAG: excinuclease ABC subunit UvrC [Candidatus Gastranaerophilales bacterium]|nr:excinuclease ABC subunit UvrC [Candidatus Gastranaerophilales bacterium]